MIIALSLLLGTIETDRAIEILKNATTAGSIKLYK